MPSQSFIKRNPHLFGGAGPAKDSTPEIALHNQIIAHCRAQWPPWKYIHADPSCKSTIGVGCQDFTIFLPGGKVLCVECKRHGGKASPGQLAWHREMQMLGHTVHLLTTMREFLEVVDRILMIPCPKKDSAPKFVPAI